MISNSEVGRGEMRVIWKWWIDFVASVYPDVDFSAVGTKGKVMHSDKETHRSKRGLIKKQDKMA